ncbi:MAG: hypothetical protein ACR2HB_02235, partial [Dehalococcoidia bacterium]
GWDPALPLYKPLPLFQAARAALAQPQPRPIPWTHPAPSGTRPPAPPPSIARAAFIGDAQGELGRRLTALGVPLHAGLLTATGGFSIVDADALTEADSAPAKTALERLRDHGGVMLWMLGAGKARPETLDTLLPAPVRLTQHPATAFTPNPNHPWVRALTAADLYFAEDGANRFLQRYGLAGKLVDQGQVVLRASETDWSLFNNAPERVKCGAVVLYEQLAKPSGAALVEIPYGKGKIVLCTLDYRVRSRAADALWRKLLTNMGLKLNAPQQTLEPAFEGDALINALSIGRFGAADRDAALAEAFISETTIAPRQGTTMAGLAWKLVTSPSKDHFLLHENEAGAHER